jgi:hypothetical protein
MKVNGKDYPIYYGKIKKLFENTFLSDEIDTYSLKIAQLHKESHTLVPGIPNNQKWLFPFVKNP